MIPLPSPHPSVDHLAKVPFMEQHPSQIPAQSPTIWFTKLLILLTTRSDLGDPGIKVSNHWLNTLNMFRACGTVHTVTCQSLSLFCLNIRTRAVDHLDEGSEFHCFSLCALRERMGDEIFETRQGWPFHVL